MSTTATRQYEGELAEDGERSTAAPSFLALAPIFVVTAGCAALAYAAYTETLDFVAVVLLPLAAVCLAVTLLRKRETPPSAPASSLPPVRRSWVQGKERLTDMGDRMISQCQRQQQSLSIIVMQLSDLAEMKDLFGSQVASHLVRNLVKTLHAVAPAKGVVLRTDATVFTLLLPGFDRGATLEAVTQAFGPTVAVEIDAQELEIVLVPEYQIRTVDAEPTAMAAVYEDMLRQIDSSRAREVRRRRHLRQEHESYSTKPAALHLPDSKQPAYVRHEPTVPVPMGTR